MKPTLTVACNILKSVWQAVSLRSALTALLLAPLAALALEPTSLRSEFLENPLGLDTDKPRFSWIVEDAAPGARQTAYQVQAASSEGNLAKGEADLWDSGKVASDETLGIEYNGRPLASRLQAWWRVKVWDGAGNASPWSRPARFSIGLLDPRDWKAQWIGAPPDDSVSAHFGFRSADAHSAEDVQWVQVELPAELPVDGVVLWGGWSVDLSSPPGDGFPVRFKIETATRADFSDAQLAVDRTREDFPNPGLDPVRFDFPAVTARYVRLTATKLSGSWMRSGPWTGVWDREKDRPVARPDPRKNKSTRWHLALAEMEILSGGKNAATGAAVAASNAFEDSPPPNAPKFEKDGWKRAHLTDGRTEGTPGSLASPGPVPLLRKTFQAAKSVRRATLYATALGNYEARLNGEKIGDQKLAPGMLNTGRRMLHQTYDVTPLVRPGGNTLGVLLADGWHRQRTRTDLFGSARRLAAAPPALFLGQLELEYDDGSVETVATDGTWQCHPDGPWRYASMYDGVTYDARKEIAGWDDDAPEGAGWQPVSVGSHSARPVPQAHEPIRILGEFSSQTFASPKPGVRIHDFGTSMAGFCRITADGPAGATVRLRYAEALKPDGSLFVENLDGNHDNADVLILDGQGPHTFEPDFTYHGFRYVEVTVEGGAEVADLQALSIGSATRQTGFFESSDPRLNQLASMVERSYRSNMVGVNVDVAGRDERNAWMGDCLFPQVQAMAWLMDSSTYLANTVRSVRAGANADGLPHSNAVRNQPDAQPAEAFYADSGIVAAWNNWLNYADRRILEDGYAMAARFMDAVAARSKDGLPGDNYKVTFGDWLSSRMAIPPGGESWGKFVGKGAPDDLYGAAVWAQSADLTSRMASALGRPEESRRYAEMRDRTRQAILEKFVRTDGAIVGGAGPRYAELVPGQKEPGGADEQSNYALLLGMGHLPPERTEASQARLLEAIEKYQGHLATGTPTTIYLLRHLADHGHQDLAYRLVMQPDYPSFGFMVDHGATAMWERWDAWHPTLGYNPANMNGLNHIGFNSVYEWLFGSLSGIRPDPDQPGYKHFFIEPKPPRDLDWVKARYESVRGPITVEWKRDQGMVNLAVSVPANTSATVQLPDGTSRHLESGRHQFTVDQPVNL